MTLEKIMIALEDSDLPDPVYLAVERLLRAGQVMRDEDPHTQGAQVWDKITRGDK